jgi:hypothetical protein
MSDIRAPRVEINGRPAGLEQIWELDLSSGGHFTAMQIRDRKTLGLEFHLARLDAATRELFGDGLDGDRLRAFIRHALGPGVADATVRVNVFRPAGSEVSVAVSVRPPAAPPDGEQCLQTVTYQRPAAHIKRYGGFGQSYYGSLAQENGFDEALFTGPDGAIYEGSITNIGFIDGRRPGPERHHDAGAAAGTGPRPGALAARAGAPARPAVLRRGVRDQLARDGHGGAHR